ncbi:GTP diphosphokinase [Motilimonas sp. 1_MG-2023]|uniref:GTP diphosphokinase n=1 Tax=Motilimonas sp. 1_MG-2023 TaxID=3062672 RepID=UPI0026E45A55|nr:GTP diphosphokinase [Motilimonas sp. 1_MG-2023]MDO6527667.1 GTP diphosphokinase [Motilimonas sp. 1_MG-2023]
MVSVRDTHFLNQQERDPKAWAASLGLNEKDQQKVEQVYLAVHAISEASQRSDVLEIGVEMVEILITMNMDVNTLKAALLFPAFDRKLKDSNWITEQFGKNTCKLVQGVADMEAIRTLQNKGLATSDLQIDNLRRMLLAMVEDVRAVVIKLAERICYLRLIKNAAEETRVLTAREIADIYAPLANRLGIGQLKWELEDLSFRYLHPDTYKKIAKQLDEKRIDRETYIGAFVSSLRQGMKDHEIKAEVYGRPKHIYSIWKKMQKKSLAFDELFDVRAVRIICERIQDCYAALGVVHTLFNHIPSEFDDYVANPKPNGYQSIHTVVLGPSGRPVEIQIRTREMHENAELGVAAHWKYKEGSVGRDNGYEDRIAWLRKLIAWQDDMAESGNLVDEVRSQVFEERVYVFTPKGEVVDLPAGSTPLDFAYYIHSQVGHRCIGSKVGGKIVPFTYHLQTGDQVEIITQKEPNPSRDWLNAHTGYVNSSRARAKIATWFRQLDKEKHVIAGKEMLESELAKHQLKLNAAEPALKKINLSSMDDLFAGIGSGDVRINQLINIIQGLHHKPTAEEADRKALEEVEKRSAAATKKKRTQDHVVVDGVGNLMTSIARCCQPVPGDDICGYITQGRGISVHRTECEQLKDLEEVHPERIIEAQWGRSDSSGYSLTVRVTAMDRSGLLKDITTLLSNEKVNVLGVKSHSDTRSQTAIIDMELEINNVDSLSKVLSKVNSLKGVSETKRI